MPELSTNERNRLDELDSYHILGEIEQSDYDFITKVASQICGTKISLISLIAEDKQWFLSHHGLEIRETPREFAFCSHAINKPEDVFIIEDSRKDIRFKENPLVTGDPNIVFYVGVSLVSEKGYPLGTLCVIDDKPKHLSTEQIETLKMLSKQVMQVLELRKKSIVLKELNDKFLKTEKLFNESQRLNKIGAWELDLNTGITHWTDEVYNIHELPLDFNHNFVNAIDFYHPDDRNLITKALNKTLSRGINFDVVCRLITAKDKLKWVRVTGIKWNQIENQPKLIGSFQDITKIKLAKERLDESLAKNKAIFDASSLVSIIITDVSGIITGFNKGAELQLGYKAVEIIGKHSIERLHSKTEIEAVGKELSKKLNTKIEGLDVLFSNAKLGIPETRNWTYIRKDNTDYPVLLSISAIKRNGDITGFLSVGRDIYKIKKVEKDLISLLNISEDQNGRLKNFAYIVSHNLRSHSNGIAMLLDLLKNDNPEIYENDLIKHLQKSSYNLTDTIKHLTDVVQINAQTKDNFIVVPLRPIIEKNCSSLLSLAKKNEVKLKNEVPDNINVIGITAYIDSIILNFLTNGIKYSSKNRVSFIEIKAELVEEFVMLTFKDNGLGIDLKKHGHQLFGIYKTFHKHEDSRGVGLFITKNQIESMGGHIEVESEINVGTTFKIFLKSKK
ncbi:PAS domain S-box protein [Flavobacterium cellulosilyticum]|uniref:histidine kinase n=1 Tax=Flavobacterium cellulosilyticum TaxID=2541731 RepID=A0A4R5CFA1_9FLAO|nr:PAS domain S-box protein [Flavobacterium cellulosilyticum]TDD95904.1 PAS domain S-box protein [Flavobacterium cellulosilyticum]